MINDVVQRWQSSSSQAEYEKKVDGSKENSSSSSNTSSQRLYSRFMNRFRRLPHSPLTWSYLSILGFIAAFFAAFMDYFAMFMLNCRLY